METTEAVVEEPRPGRPRTRAGTRRSSRSDRRPGTRRLRPPLHRGRRRRSGRRQGHRLSAMEQQGRARHRRHGEPQARHRHHRHRLARRRHRAGGRRVVQPELAAAASGDGECLLRTPPRARAPRRLHTRFTEPRIARITGMLERARGRGELGPDVDVAMAASLVPSLMLQRALMTGHPPGSPMPSRSWAACCCPVLGRPARTSQPDHRHGDNS